MAYTNLTAAQELAVVNALNTQFMGLDQQALLRFADVLVGVVSAGDAALTATVGGHATSIGKLNTWGTTLATKMNADAGITDTNYATNSQA